MLNDTCVLPFIDEGETVAADHGFSRDGFPINSGNVSFANFVADDWVADPSIPKNWFTMTPTEPKKVSNFNGMRRGHIAFYREVTVPSPVGDSIEAVANIHLNTSLPDGMTGPQIEEMLRAAIALIQSQHALDHIKSGQI